MSTSIQSIHMHEYVHINEMVVKGIQVSVRVCCSDCLMTDISVKGSKKNSIHNLE